MPELESLQFLLQKCYKLNSFIENGLIKPILLEMNYKQMTGKLLYIHCCVKPAQLFLNRTLANYVALPPVVVYNFQAFFFKDINWLNF